MRAEAMRMSVMAGISALVEKKYMIIDYSMRMNLMTV